MSVNLTEEQRRAVEARGRVIVSASAGSGKTFVMITRLVDLILSGTDVSEVLAVTFTNKAAAQMREKLRSELMNRIAVTQDKEVRARLKAQLAALPLADVSTIHSFCARLLRTNFFLVDLDPAFKIVPSDDPQARTLSARALNEVFDRAYEQGDEAFYRLLKVYFRKKKDAYLRELVGETYAALRDEPDFLQILERAGRESFFEQACEYVAQDFTRRARDIARAAEQMKERFASSPRAKALAEEIVLAAQNVTGTGGLFSMRELLFPALPSTPRRTKGNPEEWDDLTRLGELGKKIKDLYAEIKEIESEETERARCNEADERAAALCSLVKNYDEAYTRLKREAGVLDYGDLERYAAEVLKVPAVQEALHAKYKYVFVDEYQDVNPMQEGIVSLLAGGDLFLVGDAKQAIYAFRGSDSEFFEQKERRLPVSLKLTQNFRSARNILSAVNRVFTALPQINYSPMTGGERYGDYGGEVLFHRVRKREREESGELAVYSVLNGSGKRDTSAAAEKIVSLVEAELGKDWFDADAETPQGRGAWKKTGCGDIAVLVRKKSGDAERVVRMLGERGIPVTTTAAVNACDFFEARLIIDWLSLLDNAEQDIPLAGAMLSLVGGFREEELAKIRAKYKSVYEFRSACRRYADEQDDDLAKKLKTFFGLLSSLRAKAHVKTAAETIDLLLSMGLEAQIAAKPDGENRLARVQKLVSAAESAGSVHAFLSDLKAADYRVDFSESGGENAVKVLTMHASKGLEYPVVILANLDTAFRGSEREEIVWTKKFLSAPKSYDAENRRVYETVVRRASLLFADEEDRKGERNLLYVAMTRARCRLHLLFDEKEGAGAINDASKLSDFFDLSRFGDLFAEDAETERAERAKETYLRPALQERQDERLSAVYGMGERYPHGASTALHVKSSATDLMRRGADEAERPLYFADGVHPKSSIETGLAYHAFLEQVDFARSAEEELARMEREGALGKEQLSQLDLRKLKEILNIPAIAALKTKRVRREQKFMIGLPANEIEETDATELTVYQGAIDLLYEDGEGFGIIDYKYSSLPDTALKEKYAVQIRLYRKAVSRILRVDESKVRACIVNILSGVEIPM